jgi:hypothetical protein
MGLGWSLGRAFSGSEGFGQRELMTLGNGWVLGNGAGMDLDWTA